MNQNTNNLKQTTTNIIQTYSTIRRISNSINLKEKTIWEEVKEII